MKEICGKCNHSISDLEPVRCGLCERHFHNSLECCGFTKGTKDLFLRGTAMFFCAECKLELNGRSIRAYVTDTLAKVASTPPPELSELSAQVNLLNDAFAKLSGKVDNFMTDRHATSYAGVTRSNATFGAKRRRTEPDQPIRAAKKGTKTVSFNNLSIATVVAEPPPQRFWLYLAGFNPKISNDDIGKIVAQCLELEKPLERDDVVRLVPKDANTSRYTFVSFKVGLDPELEQNALKDVWPVGISFREFDADQKNSNLGRGGTPTIESELDEDAE